MDKKNVEKLCGLVGDVIKVAAPIIIGAIIKDSVSKEKDNQE